MLTRLAAWSAGCALATIVLTPALGPTAPAQADTSTCQGRPTTLVVTTTGGEVAGTSGDVIVISVPGPFAVAVVDAGAGDDVICIEDSGPVQLVAGEGNDTMTAVDHASGPGSVTVDLGGGDDSFAGGPEADYVRSGPGADTTATGGGNDSVLLSPTSDPATTVDLGEGDDSLVIAGAGFTAPVQAGPGSDTLHVSSPTPVDRVGLDLQQGTVTIVSAAVRFNSFEHYDLALQVRSFATVVGSADADDVTVTGFQLLGTPSSLVELTALLGGGSDTLTVNALVGGPLDGQDGDDTLVAVRDENSPRPQGSGRPGIRIDLAGRSLRTQGGISADLASFEAATTRSFTAVRLRGGDGAESFATDACKGTITAGGGADRIALAPGPHCSRSAHVTVRAGAGRDVVRGGSGDDVLHGGPGDDTLKGRGGRDTAYGDTGRDRCNAERRISC